MDGDNAEKSVDVGALLMLLMLLMLGMLGMRMVPICANDDGDGDDDE